MFNPIARYTHWLHTRWPAGRVENLPLVNSDGTTNVPGLFIIGDLTGIPLLKFASDTGARAVQVVAEELKSAPSPRGESDTAPLDLVIIGGGVSGFAAALEAKSRALAFEILEASQPFSTIVNFPKGKPIFTYPTDMTPSGELQFTERSGVREGLIDELTDAMRAAEIEPRIARAERVLRRAGVFEVVIPDAEPLRARRVIVAIGRSGNHRRLGIPGEDLDKVSNRLHDPRDFCDRDVAVIGGGDSALEAAIAIAECGGRVTLSYRRAELSRPKPENIEKIESLRRGEGAGSVNLMLASGAKEITEREIIITDSGGEDQRIPNAAVFALIGREPPLDFFRRSGVRIGGEGTALGWGMLTAFLVAMVALYDWKNAGFLSGLWGGFPWPDNMPALLTGWGDWWSTRIEDRSTLIGTVAVSMKSRSFYYTLVYTLCIAVFGIRRIRRRRTPYVTVQTITLFLVQLIPLFLLPEIILPLMGYSGLFSSGAGAAFADNLFPKYISDAAYAAGQWPEWGHPRAYWHAYGFILAWPLSVYNVFTSQPMAWWLAISFIQTFLIIPLLIWRWGKGAYCGWICSCGALAETMGDAHRHKMPHGPGWNRLNMIGQLFLLIAFVLLAIRILGWVWPDTWMNRSFALLLEGKGADGHLVNPVSWKWTVDVLWGGILGVGLYFKYSGRVWCRFACPLAALMHIYSRFSRFRILADKKRCISCNVCTSVCHQGIDIMTFANRGRPMEDPQCVRCSACVQSCPTGVLQFGQISRKTGEAVSVDRISASPVLMREKDQ